MPYLHPRFTERLQKNFSDFATAELLQDVPGKQKLLPAYGRIVGDINRSPDSAELFRTHDFNGNPLFTDSADDMFDVHPLSHDLRTSLLHLSYIPFHRELQRRISAWRGPEEELLLVIDIHDTGQWMLGSLPEQDVRRTDVLPWDMPLFVLSDGDGACAPAGVLNALHSSISRAFDVNPDDIWLNHPMKGGYVTQRYAPAGEGIGDAHRYRAHVQIELSRALYMDERTQETDPEKMQFCRSALLEALSEVANTYAEAPAASSSSTTRFDGVGPSLV